MAWDWILNVSGLSRDQHCRALDQNNSFNYHNGLAIDPETKNKESEAKKHTTAGIRWWSPTQLLICRSEAYVWQSGRDAQFSSVCGRM
jgi:hypothetical protein